MLWDREVNNRRNIFKQVKKDESRYINGRFGKCD